MIVVAIFAIAVILGVSMGINGSRKRRDKRDARRYLAEQYRANRKGKR